ncbi:hypothetical protein [Bradyrhizobium sp. AUGA SZCCT0158]|uniref:hypothetical protein n=1 Tax=Bradyrhizobium sp. AUGA SZCCT0158 TaxID=2807661 RepID=UPI001BABCE78|nr:hypothetical protein [Bradyrhizobium sp. AUGA SZCCT0158]
MEARKLALTLLVMLAIGLSAWAVETLVDRYWARMGLAGRFLIMLGLALGFGFAAIALAA